MNTLLFAVALSPIQQAIMLAGALLVGVAAGWFAVHIVDIVNRPQPAHAQAWEFQVRRRMRLREGSRVFRWCEPLIDEIKDLGWLQRLGGRSRVEDSLRQGASELPWTPAEFVGTAAVQGIMGGAVVAAAVCWSFGPVAGVVAGLLVALFHLRSSARALEKSAKRRMARFKRRLPFAIDLMALMLEVGGDFRKCLATVVRENRKHPLGEEFGRMLEKVSAGQPFRDALQQMQKRMHDEDVNEMTFAVKNAEELGTPLSQTFLTLAEQMRLKRGQRAEKQVGEAQTMMTFPGFIIMIACLLITVAPFVLAALNKSSM